MVLARNIEGLERLAVQYYDKDIDLSRPLSIHFKHLGIILKGAEEQKNLGDMENQFIQYMRFQQFVDFFLFPLLLSFEKRRF